MTPPLSVIPLLFVIQLGFLFAAALKTGARHALVAVFVLSTALIGWGYASASMAIGGLYDSAAFLALFPGFWLPVVPFAILGTVLTLAVVRKGLTAIVDSVSSRWFVAVQALRIAAIGTLIKAIQGHFPWEVELAIGLTDLVFGFSALWLFFRMGRAPISADALMLWHITGLLIVLLPGMASLQFGLPGPLRVFHEYPTSEVMLDWPMVLAPTLVVPIFLLLNMMAAVAAYRSKATHFQEEHA